MTNHVKRYRESVKLTQQQLADKVGCRRETIANLEKGKYNPSLMLAYNIVKTINESPLARFQYQIEDVFGLGEV